MDFEEGTKETLSLLAKKTNVKEHVPVELTDVEIGLNQSNADAHGYEPVEHKLLLSPQETALARINLLFGIG